MVNLLTGCTRERQPAKRKPAARHRCPHGAACPADAPMAPVQSAGSVVGAPAQRTRTLLPLPFHPMNVQHLIARGVFASEEDARLVIDEETIHQRLQLRYFPTTPSPGPVRPLGAGSATVLNPVTGPAAGGVFPHAGQGRLRDEGRPTGQAPENASPGCASAPATPAPAVNPPGSGSPEGSICVWCAMERALAGQGPARLPSGLVRLEPCNRHS